MVLGSRSSPVRKPGQLGTSKPSNKPQRGNRGPTRKTILGHEFERVTAIIQPPESNLDDVWDNASARERRVMVEELIEAVTIHADRLEVTITGAPPLIIGLDEVGLRDPGTGPVVSKGGLEPPRP